MDFCFTLIILIKSRIKKIKYEIRETKENKTAINLLNEENS